MMMITEINDKINFITKLITQIDSLGISRPELEEAIGRLGESFITRPLNYFPSVRTTLYKDELVSGLKKLKLRIVEEQSRVNIEHINVLFNRLDTIEKIQNESRVTSKEVIEKLSKLVTVGDDLAVIKIVDQNLDVIAKEHMDIVTTNSGIISSLKFLTEEIGLKDSLKEYTRDYCSILDMDVKRERTELSRRLLRLPIGETTDIPDVTLELFELYKVIEKITVG
jgi:hypothetical protein